VDKFDEAWRPVRENFLKHNTMEESYYNDNTGRRIVNVRFDWEIDIDPDTFDFDTLSPEHLDGMWKVLKQDLEDLYENGDRGNIADALLHAMDGSKKRSKKLTLVAFPQVDMHREYKPKKGTMEYTVFIIVYGEWE
jgi:hypothetical protein